jgi:hypothetical protein
MRNFPNHSEVKEGERLRSKRSLSTCRSGELYDTHYRRWDGFDLPWGTE